MKFNRYGNKNVETWVCVGDHTVEAQVTVAEDAVDA
jgi:hypothetical protein